MTLLVAIVLGFSLGFGSGFDKCSKNLEQCKVTKEELKEKAQPLRHEAE